MKNWIFSFTIALISFSGFAQADYEEEESFLIGKLEIRPSLSTLQPPIPGERLVLRGVDFSKKEVKRQVNMLGIVERKKNRQVRTVELRPLFASKGEKEESPFQLSDDLHFRNRASNYDYFTGKTKNAAYRELRAGMLQPSYSPFMGRRYRSPYRYSPFLR